MESPLDIPRYALKKFLLSCGPTYIYPAAVRVDILTPAEEDLRRQLASRQLTDTQKLGMLRQASSPDWVYHLATFGVRLAVDGVRHSNREHFRLGTLATTAALGRLPWNDALRSLAMLEHCAGEMHVDFRSIVRDVARATDADSIRAIVDAFFRRAAELRSIDALRIHRVHEGVKFTFRIV